MVCAGGTQSCLGQDRAAAGTLFLQAQTIKHGCGRTVWGMTSGTRDCKLHATTQGTRPGSVMCWFVIFHMNITLWCPHAHFQVFLYFFLMVMLPPLFSLYWASAWLKAPVCRVWAVLRPLPGDRLTRALQGPPSRFHSFPCPVTRSWVLSLGPFDS